MPEPLPRYLGSGTWNVWPKMEVTGLVGSKVLSALSSMSCNPPCHPVEPQLCLDLTLTTLHLILFHFNMNQAGGVTALISWCDAQKGRMTCSSLNRWEGADLESAPSSAASLIEIGYSSSQALEATVSHSHWPQSSSQEREANGWPRAWHCVSTFTSGAHNSPLKKHWKPPFFIWGNSGQGRETNGPGTQFWVQRVGPFIQITLRPW